MSLEYNDGVLSDNLIGFYILTVDIFLTFKSAFLPKKISPVLLERMDEQQVLRLIRRQNTINLLGYMTSSILGIGYYQYKKGYFEEPYKNMIQTIKKCLK
jgi:hypothetical protein